MLDIYFLFHVIFRTEKGISFAFKKCWQGEREGKKCWDFREAKRREKIMGVMSTQELTQSLVDLANWAWSDNKQMACLFTEQPELAFNKKMKKDP